MWKKISIMIIIMIIIIMITSASDIQPSTLILDLSPSELAFSHIEAIRIYFLHVLQQCTVHK